MALLFSACTVNEKDDEAKNVDQAAFLKNTSVIIFNNYQSLIQEVNKLKLEIDTLDRLTNIEQLLKVKAQLKSTYLKWQKVSMLEFGPAETAALKSAVNIFKTDTAQIELNIISGNYNLDQISMKDAKGFPALDYLLNGKIEVDLIKMLNSTENRIQYINAVINDIKSKVDQVTTEWDTYQTTFANASGTDVGSSTGMLINSMNLHFEKFLKDNKIGIPLGIRSSGIKRPDFSEAFYGGYSVELVKANFDAIKNIYLGGTNYGLDDYLNDANAVDLNERIKNQIMVIDLKLNALSGTLPYLIDNEHIKLQETYNEMQKLIVLLKVELPSRMGVLITYQDNDGD